MANKTTPALVTKDTLNTTNSSRKFAWYFKYGRIISLVIDTSVNITMLKTMKLDMETV